MYGALLLRELRRRLPGLEVFGCCGDRMREAGCETLVDAHELAMVGLVEVIPGIPRVLRAFNELGRQIHLRRPRIAILIDSPDFNLRLARRLKKAGVPVVYFVAPQVWAWRRGRLRSIRACVDRLLCIFPFEEKFFREAGIDAEFIGHPLVGRTRPQLLVGAFRERAGVAGVERDVDRDAPLIALLPGSRKKEIRLNLGPMLGAARLLAESHGCRFVLPAASTVGAEWMREQVRDAGVRLHVVEGLTYDALAYAGAAIVASGTASTEAALIGTPMVIVYRVSPLSWAIGRRLVRIPFFSMVNLVAGREVVPEFIQDRFQPEPVAREVRLLLDSPERRAEMKRDLNEISNEISGRFRYPVASPVRSAAASGQQEATSTSGVPDTGAGLERIGEGNREENQDAIQRAAGIVESILRDRTGS